MFVQVSIGKQWKEFLDHNENIGFIFHVWSPLMQWLGWWVSFVSLWLSHVWLLLWKLQDDAQKLDKAAKNRYTVWAPWCCVIFWDSEIFFYWKVQVASMLVQATGWVESLKAMFALSSRLVTLMLQDVESWLHSKRWVMLELSLQLHALFVLTLSGRCLAEL